MVKGGVNSFRRKHGNKCAKPMKMEGGEDVPGEFCQVHMKRDVQILERSFEGVKVLLGSGDPMEEANKVHERWSPHGREGSPLWHGGQRGFRGWWCRVSEFHVWARKKGKQNVIEVER